MTGHRTRPFAVRASQALGALGAVLGVTWVAWSAARVAADEPLLRSHDVATAFSIRRSVNRNRVDYGVRVTAACRADGAEPVFAYWRMLETDGGVEPLLLREEPAYGVASQTVRAGSQGRVVDVQLRAVGDRQVTVQLEQTRRPLPRPWGDAHRGGGRARERHLRGDGQRAARGPRGAAGCGAGRWPPRGRDAAPLTHQGVAGSSTRDAGST
jgi:hypothetical protein